MHWEMENEESSRVKLINRRRLAVKPYIFFLICGKRAGKENLWGPEKKGISVFVMALGTRGAWNNLGKSPYDDVFDFNNNTLINNKVSIKRHLSCYEPLPTLKSYGFLKSMSKALAL